MKESTRVLVALGAGVAGGTAIAASGNASLLRAADLIAPVGALWVNAIRMTVIPLVVSLLVTGVASATDVKWIGRLGGRTVLVFVLLLTGTAIIVMPLGRPLFALLPPSGVAQPPPGAAEAAGQIATSGQPQSLSAWLSSLLPANPIAAAATGAMVPLILFTLLFALATARSPAAARLTLVGLFALVLPLAAHSGAAFAGGISFYIVAYSAASLAMTALLYPVVALAGNLPMRHFARAALPAQLIAFSSSSSVASLPALVESAERSLGLPSRVTGFVLPLAVSTFRVAAPLSWTVGALFVGWFYSIPLHTTDLATIAFAAVFLAFVAPGVPRGAFLMLTPLFLAIGLPAEGIGILIAADALPDTVSTVLNVTGDLAAAVLVARAESKVRL